MTDPLANHTFTACAGITELPIYAITSPPRRAANPLSNLTFTTALFSGTALDPVVIKPEPKSRAGYYLFGAAALVGLGVVMLGNANDKRAKRELVLRTVSDDPEQGR